MKKLFLILVLCLSCFSMFAEKITLRTGDALALSITDFFFPVDINVTGSKCSITSVKNIEKDLWCITIAAWRAGATSAPVNFEYYVRVGDTIKLRRINDPMNECNLKVLSLKWNEAVLDIQ